MVEYFISLIKMEPVVSEMMFEGNSNNVILQETTRGWSMGILYMRQL